MIRLSRWKVTLVLVAALLAILFALPNVLPQATLAKMPGWLPHQKLNLGLDLQGGSYLLYEVDTSALRGEKLVNLTEDVRTTLRGANIGFANPGVVDGSVVVEIIDATKVQAAYKELEKLATPLTSGTGRSLDVQTAPGQHIRLTLSEQGLNEEARAAVDQSMKVIRRRIDSKGTKEVAIVKQGATRIVIEAPGESDPERLKQLIGQTAKLTFQMVDDTVSPQDLAAGRIPPGSVLLPSTESYDPNGVVVKRHALITGEMLSNAGFATSQQTGQPVVTFRFNGIGTRKFGEATVQNTGKRFAIVLDNKVISAPNINEPITTGSGEISGNFTDESANDLALLLKSGALPAKLNVLEQRTVGAELGGDAIRSGVISIAIGAVAILIFIMLAYGLFGVFAAIALFVNVTMLIAIMTAFQATLTLPGIAGMILTLAVAVDANVLIYERARDEARLRADTGKPPAPYMAMDHGYSLALPSIIDANLTTMISALIMFNLGAGPVRGFAWTLMTGVMTSVFTAVLVTQVLIGWWFKVARPKKLPI